MSFIGDVIGSITGTKQAGEAAERGAEQQAAAAREGIGEQRRQFDTFINLMAPYVGAGVGGPGVTGSLQAQQELLGLRGEGAQQRAISGLEQSPILQALSRQGEEALLQRASATGGLRGGNVQAALAQFRPQLLSDLIQQQFSNLGGLTKIGQASAAGQAAGGLESAGAISNLIGQAGAARASGTLAAGRSTREGFGDALDIAKLVIGAF